MVITSTPVKQHLERKENEKKVKEEKKVKRETKVKKSLDFGKAGKKANIGTQDEITICPGCNEKYYEAPPEEEWIKCNECKEWWHEDCSNYEDAGHFLYDYC